MTAVIGTTAVVLAAIASQLWCGAPVWTIGYLSVTGIVLVALQALATGRGN